MEKEFECDSCGKNPVDYPGEWCSECQEKEAIADAEWQSKWFSKCSLCIDCDFAWGPDPTDKCGAYNMPLYMVARKRKCKKHKSS